MLRRSSRILFEISIGCLAGMILLTVVTVWRLSQAPLHLYFLSPFLEQALSGAGGAVSADIEDTILVLGEGSRTLDLKALGVRLQDRDGFTIATLPEVSINLSLRALLRGVVAATKIEIIGARVTLIRSQDGDFDFGQEQDDERSQDALTDLSVIAPALVAELLSDADPERPLSFLRSAKIRDGSLSIYDRKLRTFWHAPTANIALRRESYGLSGDLDLKLAVGQIEMDLSLDLIYREAEAKTVMAAKFEDLRLGVFAGLDERLAPLAGFEVPLRGTVSTVLEGDGFVHSIAFDLSAGSGVVSLPEYLPEALTVKRMDLRGRLDGIAEQLELEQVALAFAANPDGGGDGPVVTVNGLARIVEGDLKFDVEGKVVRMPADDLGRYWPLGLASGARDWVTTNIRKGMSEEATIEASFRVPSGDFETVEVESLSGAYRYRDLDLHYLRPMAPINGVSGTATFDADLMTFDVDGGVLDDLVVGRTMVEIDFRDQPEQIFIDAPVSGPVQSSLKLLDHERLNLISGLGINPSDSSGTGEVRAQFGFPLIGDLTFDHIEIGVTAQLEEVGVKQVLFGKDAHDGTLDLKLDNAGMMITGPVEFDGLPADLKWRENFRDNDGPTSVFDIQAPELDETDLASFGLDLRPYLKGPVSASVTYSRYQEQKSDVDLLLDLNLADLSFPFIYWNKDPGAGGEMRFGIKLSNDEVEVIERIEVRAGTLTAVGRGMLDETKSRLARLELDELQFGQSRLSNVTVTQDGETVAVDAGSGVFDATPFLSNHADAEDSALLDEFGEDQEAFRIRAPRLDAVLFGDGRYLETVTLELERRKQGWENIAVTAEIPEALWTKVVEEEKPRGRLPAGRINRLETGTYDEIEIEVEKEPEPEVEAPPEDRFFRLRYRPAATGGYYLKVVSNDIGALLRAMDLRDTILGGRLEITGQSEGPIPYHSLSAHLEATDYALVGAPTLAKVLTVASMTGLRDTLSGKGIRFDRLSGDVTLTDGVVETELLHAFGPAIGVTAKGKMDFDRGQLDLEGTVVPAYSVNRIIGMIPGIGFLLTGGERGGFLALTYDVEGGFDDPEVSVDALSILAPGFLRGLFGGIDGEAPTVFPPGPAR